jgi:plastocyanin
MSRVAVCALFLFLAAGFPATLAAGTLRGQVEVLEKKDKKASDLSDVVVWVEGPRVTPTPSRATINMKKKRFEPSVVVVPVGGEVAFPNMDPILHNAFSVSGENRFDLELYKKPESRSHVFQHPGIVRVYCNIHPQMSAFVVVRDNPYWARVGKGGRFTIEGVPAGKWVVAAWHPRAADVVAQDVVVTETGAAEVALKLDASRYKRGSHLNKYGKKYDKDSY